MPPRAEGPPPGRAAVHLFPQAGLTPPKTFPFSLKEVQVWGICNLHPTVLTFPNITPSGYAEPSFLGLNRSPPPWKQAFLPPFPPLPLEKQYVFCNHMGERGPGYTWGPLWGGSLVLMVLPPQAESSVSSHSPGEGLHRNPSFLTSGERPHAGRLPPLERCQSF